MSNDNLGNFFQAENFDDNDNNGDSWKMVKIYGNNLFKMAIDILNLTQTICDLLPEEDDHADITKRLMLENAMVVPAKIKGALAVDIYKLLMENAVIIKVNICQLRDQLWACKAIHNVEEQYANVLYQQIEEFKIMFVLWVTSFDRDNDVPDEWNLFNDPTKFPTDDTDS